MPKVALRRSCDRYGRPGEASAPEEHAGSRQLLRRRAALCRTRRRSGDLESLSARKDSSPLLRASRFVDPMSRAAFILVNDDADLDLRWRHMVSAVGAFVSGAVQQSHMWPRTFW